MRDFEPGSVASQAHMLVEVELLDAKRDAVVGRFDVKLETSHGIDIDPESRASRMLRAVSARIFDWLRAHRD